MIGSPSLRRAAIDTLATAHFPAYADDLATYGRTLQQRNSLLRAIREETATRDQLRFWDDTFLDTGGSGRRGAAPAPRAPGRRRSRPPTARSRRRKRRPVG